MTKDNLVRINELRNFADTIRMYMSTCDLSNNDSVLHTFDKCVTKAIISHLEERNIDCNVECIISLKKMVEAAVLPTKKHDTDSGWDLYAAEDIIINPQDKSVVVHTGLQLAGLSSGYELQVRSRSSLAFNKTIIVVNGVGTIDNSYRGEIMIIMKALHDIVYIFKGDKIAQLVPVAIPVSSIGFVDEVSSTERGSGGFGSTGR